ncbi:hypothetical protein PIB30_094065 [Stylosanthes scabra]|uniref:Aminotransferase-like plant mobile domain-containing protein n=1 Tax=Stylosanthes scabra TaxID=79078 RepID=A0ABU6ZTY3_9FABA|nr:hypothetical protein [Stylosanthes scabra]
MAHDFLGGRPPAGEGKNYSGVKMSWLRERVRATPRHGAFPDVLRPYARCYIMMMIGGALFPDKTNNIVSLRCVPLLRDFDTCSKLSWCSGRLQTPDVVVDLPEIPDLVSTRQRSTSLPLVSRLNGLGRSSRDHHSRRMLHVRSELDRIGFDDFIWTPYILSSWRAVEPDWVSEVGELWNPIGSVSACMLRCKEERPKRLYRTVVIHDPTGAHCNKAWFSILSLCPAETAERLVATEEPYYTTPPTARIK